MKIREIKQLDNGRQKKSYADHIYKWELDIEGKPNEIKDEVLEFCQKYLEHASHERAEYLQLYRSNLGFEETMKLVCGGSYTLTFDRDKWVWIYTVIREYID